MLAGHVWLINERGVATIEPSDGHEVHGVVWDVTDDDLAALDGFEGVPDRYARSTHTVLTADGPVEAVVYVDPRTEPGPPREGYLEIVVARRASSTGCPSTGSINCGCGIGRAGRPSMPLGFEPGGPTSLTDLLAVPGVEETIELRSTFGFMAFHGGHLEAMTDVIASRAAAEAGASFYGVHHPPEHRHHLSSTRFDPTESPRLAQFLDHVDVVVSVHGYGRKGRWLHLLAGGTNRDLADHVATHVGPGAAALLRDHRSRRHPGRAPRHAPGQPGQPPPTSAASSSSYRLASAAPRPAAPSPARTASRPIVHDLVAGLAAAARTWPRTP